MWSPELGHGQTPIYLAIADAIWEDVRNGRLTPGARLPAQRELAKTLGIDFTTVTRAYAEARRRGLVAARVGQGTFVTGPIPGDPRGVVPAAIVDLSMNSPPRPSDPRLLARMWGGFADLERRDASGLLFRYELGWGAAEDRAAGAAWLADRIEGLTMERLVVSPGIQPGIVAVLSELAKSGDVVCAPAVTYTGLRVAAAHLGLTLASVPMAEEGATPEGFERVCREMAPKAFYCTPTLHSPTGETTSMQGRREIVRIARRYGVALVEDDAFGKLPEAPLPPLASLAPEITWHIAGLSKSVAAGLRVAYVVAPDVRGAERLAVTLRALIGMTSPLMAALATHWIRNGVAADALKAIRAETRVRRRIAADALGAEHLDCEASHLWLRLPKGWSRAAFCDDLRHRKVSVVPSDAFTIGSNPPEAVRIGLGAPANHEELTWALRTIGDVLGGFRGGPVGIV